MSTSRDPLQIAANAVKPRRPDHAIDARHHDLHRRAGTRVMDYPVIRAVGGTGDIVIGEPCWINPRRVLYSGSGIRIGNHVAIAPGTSMFPPIMRSRGVMSRSCDRVSCPRAGGS